MRIAKKHDDAICLTGVVSFFEALPERLQVGGEAYVLLASELVTSVGRPRRVLGVRADVPGRYGLYARVQGRRGG